MMNPAKLLKLKSSWDIFSKNHPKFIKYLEAVQKNAIQEGTIVTINITTADGKSLDSNLRLTQSDIELLRELREI